MTGKGNKTEIQGTEKEFLDEFQKLCYSRSTCKDAGNHS